MVLGFSGCESGIQPQILTKLKKNCIFTHLSSVTKILQITLYFGIGGFL